MCLELEIYIRHEITEKCAETMDQKIDDFENLTYSKRLKDHDLFSAEGKLLRADVIKCWKVFHNKCGICPEDIFTRDYRFKIVYERFSLGCWRRLALLICSESCIFLEFLILTRRSCCS